MGRYDYRKRNRSRSNSSSSSRRHRHYSPTGKGTNAERRRNQSDPRAGVVPVASKPIPNTAPMLRVPSSLPVAITSFIDVFASFVVRGGFTLEDEVKLREKENPYFAFLFAEWKDPIQVYYRWRLYSLLQGDSAVAWRQEPFQMEDGPECYVWCPPAAIPIGTAGAAAAAAVHRQSVVLGDFKLDTVRPTSVSARWVALMMADEGKVFSTLPSAKAAAWAVLLEGCVREALNYSGGNDAAKRGTADSVALSSEFVEERMVFAIDSSEEAPQHIVSLWFDHLVACTAADLRKKGGSSTEKVKSEEDNGEQKGEEGEADEEEAVEKNAERMMVGTLSLLFVLSDILLNAKEQSQASMTAVAGVLGGTTAALLQDPSASTGPAAGFRAILRTADMVMPSVVEAVLRAMVSLLSLDDPAATATAPVASAAAPLCSTVFDFGYEDEDGNEEVSVDVLLSTNSRKREREEEGRRKSCDGCNRRGPFHLLLWLRQLVAMWKTRGALSYRCWAELKRDYPSVFAGIE